MVRDLNPAFTVIVATCGRPDRLRKMLACLARAVDTSGVAHRVVVADNHPDYTAAGTVQRFRTEVSFPVLYMKTTPRNKSCALNDGIRAAETDWLAFSDDDTLPDPGWLKEAGAFARAGAFRVFGGRIEMGELEKPVPRSVRRREGEPFPGGGVYVYYHPMAQSGGLRDADKVPFGANTFTHRTVFRDYGLYDEALWELCGPNALGIDDGEFGVRIKRAGEPIGYCSEAVVVHPVYRDKYSVKRRLRNVYAFGWREPLVFPEDHKRPAWRHLAGRVVRHLAAAIGHAVRFRASRAFACLLEAVRAYGVMRGLRSSAIRQCLSLPDVRTRQTGV